MRPFIAVGIAGTGTGTSRAALRWALRAAALADRDVLLLQVVAAAAAAGPGSTRAASRLFALTMRAASALAPNVAVSTRILRGDVAGSSISATSAASMLVVGAVDAGAAPVGGRSVGSVLTAGAGCPVVIVPNTDRRAAAGVVVGADDTDSGRAALAFAASEAAATGQRLTIVRAWSVEERWDGIGSPVLDEFARRAAAHLLERCRGVVADASPDVAVAVRSVRGEMPAALLSASVSAHLLVIGRPRSAGRVAPAALFRSTSPIAVVRAAPIALPAAPLRMAALTAR